MKKTVLISGFVLLNVLFCSAQRDRLFPKSMVVGQFAGSTGLVSAGFSKVTTRDKIELGLLYGYLPKAYGGTNHSLSLKFAWNPWQFTTFKRLSIEPVQLGVFVCQNFNKDLDFTWGKYYPKNYYWWPRATRFHPTVSTQLAYKIGSKRLDRIAYYFEANTNDLYIASYYQNMNALSLYDIVFFGMGIKLYLK